ncbi:hypothetical protein FEQ03_05341 [Burkholderia pseudomultivorans]|uniref:Mutator family transposase n=1 Tax=Burkholderia pseudomultivorans TaxID=1207504 RepID=A0ABU2EBZ3_9BURK|nr:hypothetical protein [Burkholderia pseudomultivorans]MDR8757407.1 hypothetical protein [Burkholderia pseudomultivorans]
MSVIQWPKPMPETGRLGEAKRAWSEGSAKVVDPKMDCPQTLHISLFFDGTNNNDASDNGWRDANTQSQTNVARLFDAAIGADGLGMFRFYINGVGTPFPQIGEAEYSTLGKGFAAGFGMRVAWGYTRVLNAIYSAVTGAPISRLMSDADARDVCRALTGDKSAPRNLPIRVAALIRDDGVVSNKAVYLALGIQADGQRDVLGLWIEQTEGAKFWLKVFNELKARGCQDILIAVVDGLKGLTEAIGAAYPRTTVQTCIVHLIRNSLEYASYKDRRVLAAALRPIYAAASEEAARQALQDFADGPWGAKYPTIVQSWQRAWEHVVPFYVFPPEIRRVVYTTNAIESLNMQLRKIIKTRGHFPNDEAAVKLLWLALRNVLAKAVRTAFDWKSAMNQFAILFGERFTQARG